MKTIGAIVAMMVVSLLCIPTSQAQAIDCAAALGAMADKRAVESARSLIRNRCRLPERFAPEWTTVDDPGRCDDPWDDLGAKNARAHLGDLVRGRCDAELHALGKGQQVALPACCMLRSCHAVAQDALSGYGYVSRRHKWPLRARTELVSRLREGGYCADPEVQGRTAPACATLASVVGGRGHRMQGTVERLKRAGACSPRPCCVPPVAAPSFPVEQTVGALSITRSRR